MAACDGGGTCCGAEAQQACAAAAACAASATDRSGAGGPDRLRQRRPKRRQRLRRRRRRPGDGGGTIGALGKSLNVPKSLSFPPSLSVPPSLPLRPSLSLFSLPHFLLPPSHLGPPPPSVPPSHSLPLTFFPLSPFPTQTGQAIISESVAGSERGEPDRQEGSGGPNANPKKGERPSGRGWTDPAKSRSRAWRRGASTCLSDGVSPSASVTGLRAIADLGPIVGRQSGSQ